MPQGYMEVSQNWGYHFGGPYIKDYINMLGFILGPSYLGKLQYGNSRGEH